MSRKTNKPTEENYKIVKELNRVLKSSLLNYNTLASLSYIINQYKLELRKEDDEFEDYLYFTAPIDEPVYFDKRKLEFIPVVKSENIDMNLLTGRAYKK